MVTHEFSFVFDNFLLRFLFRSKLLIKRTAMPIRWMVLSWLIYHMYKNMYNNLQLLPIYMIHTYISFELSFNIQTLPRHTHNQNLIFLYLKILFIFIVIMQCTFFSKRIRKIIYILSLDRNHGDRLTLYWYIHL